MVIQWTGALSIWTCHHHLSPVFLTSTLWPLGLYNSLLRGLSCALEAVSWSSQPQHARCQQHLPAVAIENVLRHHQNCPGLGTIGLSSPLRWPSGGNNNSLAICYSPCLAPWFPNINEEVLPNPWRKKSEVPEPGPDVISTCPLMTPISWASREQGNIPISLDLYLSAQTRCLQSPSSLVLFPVSIWPKASMQHVQLVA